MLPIFRMAAQLDRAQVAGLLVELRDHCLPHGVDAAALGSRPIDITPGACLGGMSGPSWSWASVLNLGRRSPVAHAAWDHIPALLPIWLVAVAACGSVGAHLGSRHLSDRWLRGILAVLLLGSCSKPIWQLQLRPARPP